MEIIITINTQTLALQESGTDELASIISTLSESIDAWEGTELYQLKGRTIDLVDSDDVIVGTATFTKA
jgi:hypothetical protein